MQPNALLFHPELFVTSKNYSALNILLMFFIIIPVSCTIAFILTKDAYKEDEEL